MPPIANAERREQQLLFHVVEFGLDDLADTRADRE